MNVLRYCNLDESLQGEDSLVCDNGLERLYKTKELDYMSYIVLRMFENTEVCNFEVFAFQPLYFNMVNKIANNKSWQSLLDKNNLTAYYLKSSIKNQT